MSRYSRALVRVLIAGLMASWLLAPLPASAADFEVGVGISQVSPATQESGKDFVYNLDVNCDALSPDPEAGTSCTAVIMTIPLGGLADEFTDAELSAMIDLQNLPAGATFDVVDGELVIDLGDLEAGDSSQYQLTIVPPNMRTPNGTSWTLDPELSGDNFDTASAPASVTSEATATLTHNITKSLRGSAFRGPEETVTYQLVVSCTQRSSGTIGAASMVVDDVLPAGLTFVSASPAPSTGGIGDATHTWELSPLPAGCTDAGANGTTTIEVVATVDAGIATGTSLTNRAGVTSVTTDGQNIARKSATAAVTVVDGDEPGPGTFGKRSFGQLRDRDADPSTADSGQELQSHTTYRGNWMGYRTTQPANVLDNDRPNQNTSMRQSGYIIEHNSGVAQGAGWRADVVDPVPCRDGETVGDTDKLYESRAAGDYCQAPAFHVKTVSVYSSDTGVLVAFDAAGYRPQVVYSDGTVADMQRVAATNGGREGTYIVPDLSRTDIAEIRFPADAGLSGQNLRWAVFGYVDSAVETDSVVRNTAHADLFWKDATEPSYSPSHSAELYVIDAPQIGIEKDMGNHAASYSTSLKLTARLISPGQATEDLVVTDLLPEGMTVQGTPSASAVVVAHAADDGTMATSSVPVSAGNIEVVSNFQATGRQLIRVTVPAADLVDYNAFRADLTVSGTVAYGRDPGPITNTAQVFYDADALLTACQQSPAYEQNADDPTDLDGSGSTAERNCYSQDSLTVPPPTGGANFKVTKTVQGDKDLAPKSYPGIGVISASGGTATFGVGWKNTGSSQLENAVVYDIFPRVGDTGVGGSVAGKPRNSQFDAVLVGVTNPDGVTIEYTTAGNPCRPEVYPNAQNAGCVDEWSTTAPATPAERAAVTGVRMSKNGPFAPGAGWNVGIQMTVPETVADNEIAWNSVAGGAKVVGGGQLNPNSPPKVGISANENQPLLIAKEIDDPPAQVRPGDELTYTLSVTNPNVTAKSFSGATDVLPKGLEFVSVSPAGPIYDAGTRTVSWPDGVSVNSGQTRTWTVVTRVEPGVSGRLGNVFTVPGSGTTTNPCEDDPDTVEDESASSECVDVDVQAARLTIDKTITGEAAGWAEFPIELKVTCRTGADEIDLPDDGTVTITAADVAAGSASKSLTVPFGVVCEVAETDDGGATEAAHISPASIAIDAADADGEFEVNVTNVFEAGSLKIAKQIDGVGAQFQGGEFTFDVVCTYDPAPAGDPQTVYEDTDVTVNVPAGDDVGESAILADDLPIGTTCVVTEVESGGADQVAPAVTVQIGRDAETANVTTALVTNAYSAGSISVEKTLDGDWAATGAVDSAEFDVFVRCQLDAGTGPADLWSGTVTLRGGERVTVMDGADPRLFPVGTVCFAPEETEDRGATHVDISHDSYDTGLEVTSGSPDDVQDLTIEVTNTFEAGALTLTKRAVGAGAPLAAGTYTFSTVCTFEGEVVLDRDDITIDIAAGDVSGQAASITPLPVGAECVVTETDAGIADVLPAPKVLTIVENADDNTASVEMENGYSAGVVVVQKRLDGRYADHRLVRGRSFDLEVSCLVQRGPDAGSTVVSNVKVKAGVPTVVSGPFGDPKLWPVGTQCWATETDANGADGSQVDHDSPATAIEVSAGQPDDVQDLTITATNTFDTDPDPALPGAGGPARWIAGVAVLFLALGLFLTRRRTV